MPYHIEPGDKIARKPRAAEITGLPTKTIDRMRADGECPEPIQLGARAIGWPESVLYAWLNKRAQQVEGQGTG